MDKLRGSFSGFYIDKKLEEKGINLGISKTNLNNCSDPNIYASDDIQKDQILQNSSVQEKPSQFSYKADCKHKILVVDDNNLNRIYVSELCKLWGICVDTCPNPEIALQMAEENDYHLILMDVHLPVMNGFEAAHEIRKIDNGKYTNTPIIALTADVLSCNKDIALESGMNDFLSKPFNPSQLFTVLSNYFNFTDKRQVN